MKDTKGYADKVCKLTKGKIGFYGYEFKAGTGDTRNSPILDIAKQFLKAISVHL